MKELLTSVEDLTQNLTNVETLYGEQDLSSSTLFSGGYINFGYWKDIDLNNDISKKTRTLSSKKLYSKVFESLDIVGNDAVIEVGCGLGNGSVLLHKKFKPKFIMALDASLDQIQRALKRHSAYLRKFQDSIRFLTCSADHIQMKPKSITKVFSVEALQHFSNLDLFLNSVFNVLQAGGKFVVATFFFKTNPPAGFMNLFPNFKTGIDKIIKTDEFTNMLRKQGFQDVQYQSIGEHVWNGFDKWISQTEYKETWDKNWIWAYEEGILDYFIFEARKPS